MAGGYVVKGAPDPYEQAAEARRKQQEQDQRDADAAMGRGTAASSTTSGGAGYPTPYSQAGAVPSGYGGYSAYTGDPAYANMYQSGQPLGGQAGTPSGQSGSLTQSAYERQQQEALQAKLSRDEFDYRLGALRAQGTTTTPGTVQHDSSGAEAMARANAFAQAKEKAGLNAAAALKSLQATMAGSGRAGSSQEMDRAYDILGTGRSDVNTFINKQLEADLQRAAQVSDLTYQGGITQRGQDMSQGNPLLGLITAGRLY